MKLVKQRALQDIVDKRVFVKELERQVEDEKLQLRKLEANAIVALEEGANVERGVLSGLVHEKPGQRRPSWKEEYAKVAGPEEVQRVINETAPGPATKELVIAQSGKVTKVA